MSHQLRDLLNKIFVLDQENRIKYEDIKFHPLFQDTDWLASMSEMYEKTQAPFIPTEEDFNEKPVRASNEKKKGFAAFIKDEDDKEDMVFDEEHFKKFLKEDVENKDEQTAFQTPGKK